MTPPPALLSLIALLTLLPEADRAESPPASFAYVLQADSLASTRASAVEQLAACGRDWIVLDPAFGDDGPWERSDLDAIRSGKPGRRILAYLSIGEAEDYRPYWQKKWGSHGKLTRDAPAWLGTENPDWEGNYRVKYWRPEWQDIMLAATQNAMERGFDGVYLDIVDGFENFEQNGDDYIDNRVNPETNQSYRRDMVDWVKAIARRARETNPAALVVPQNGSQLLEHNDFVATISAIGIEDLFTDGNKLQPESHTSEVLGYLKKLATTRKPVLLIEYPRKAERQEEVRKQAKANGMVLLITDRQLKTLGASGR